MGKRRMSRDNAGVRSVSSHLVDSSTPSEWSTVAGWPNGPLDPSFVKALARNMVCNGLQESVNETLHTLRRHDLAHYNSQ